MDTEVRIATSPPVAELATANLEAQGVPVGVHLGENPENEYTLVFQASGSSARSAKETAGAYALAYIQNRLDNKIEELDALEDAAQVEEG